MGLLPIFAGTAAPCRRGRLPPRNQVTAQSELKSCQSQQSSITIYQNLTPVITLHAMEYEDSFVKIAGLIGGEEYVKVARALLNTEDVTDEEIASATGLKINIVRKVLYDMFGKALITGIRVKDEKKRSEEHTSELQSPTNLVC